MNEYEKPVLEVIEFDADVITESTFDGEWT